MIPGRQLIGTFHRKLSIRCYGRSCMPPFCYKQLECNYQLARMMSVDAETDSILKNTDIYNSQKPVHHVKQIVLRGKSATTQQQSLIADFIASHEKASPEDWDKLANNVLEVQYGLLNETNLDAKIVELCKLPSKLELARSYLAFVKHQKRKFNGALVCNFLKVCYGCKSSLTDTDMKRVKVFVDYLMSRNPAVEMVLGDGIIKGLVLLNRIDEALAVLEKIKLTSAPYTESLSAVAMYFLEKNLLDRATDFITNVMSMNYTLSDDVYVMWIERLRGDRAGLDSMMGIIAGFEYLPRKLVCEHLQSTYMNLPDEHKLIGTFTKITNSGVCLACKEKLAAVDLSEEEFEHLRAMFLEKVLVGTDIFKNTTPAEFSRFVDLVKNNAPFDTVVDGLNVAYMIGSNLSQSSYVKLIDHVIKYFRDQNMKILLIGRKHMRKWPGMMSMLAAHDAKAFLIDDISEDDPFILYATLYSGINANFVTRDLMRTHKYRLQSDKDAILFKRWQRSHQIHVTFVSPTGRIYTRCPITFQQATHQSRSGGWHVPFIADEHTRCEEYGIHRDWLCLEPLRRQK